MNNRSFRTRSFRTKQTLGVIAVSLALLTSQAAGADSLRPNADAGGSGGGSTVTGNLDETFRAINLAEAGASASTSDQPAANHYRDAAHVPESQQGAANAVRQALPEFVVHPNLRSIQLIEGKQPLAEFAQPAPGNAYSICLACSTLG